MKEGRIKKRCAWAEGNAIKRVYHDTEWGVPLHDDERLFEFLVLEGMQAGLSWLTILKKRENFRRAFDDFLPEKVASYDGRKKRRLLSDEGIIRNRLKIEAAVSNAKAFLKVKKEYGTFDRYIWQFVGGKSKKNAWKSMKEVPSRTEESDAMSRELKGRGFGFVGTTICYAFMQAVGMTNDHVVECFRHKEVQKL